MKPEGAQRLHVEPISLSLANRYVSSIHRHHGRIQPGLTFAAVAAATDDGTVCGVAMMGYAIAANRLADGWRTAEVQRVATDGTPNTCSLLYGACARAAKALGFSRIITYILDTETGASVKAAGWVEDDGEFGNLSWANHTTKPSKGSNVGPKRRWSLHFTGLDRPALSMPESLDDPTMPTLFDHD